MFNTYKLITMTTVKTIVALPIAINDWLLDLARENRRTGNGPRSKEEIINNLAKEYFLQNNK